jgi:hypothetical protein
VLSASASSGSHPPANAGDDNIATRWGSGTAQASGQWFQLDLGSGTTNTLGRLILDPGASTDDYPRTYQVNVSNDGIAWGNTVVAGSGNPSGITTINLSPQTVRYVKITQTGSDPHWWSIYELNAVGTPMQALDRTGWSASASVSGSDMPAIHVLDGSNSTRWSTGVAQAANQVFQVDMGSIRSFSQIVLNAGLATYDYPRGYLLEVSTDNANWSLVANGAASTTISTLPFPRQFARYLRITQTGSATAAWSIYELNVYDTPVTAPATPGGLTLTGGDSQVGLSWSASSGAVTYTIKRATSSGGPYTVIAANVLGTSYTDTGLSNGATYHYVVLAVNNSGTSADSVPSSSAAAPLPSPWQSADIGAVGVAGNAYHVSDTYTVAGSGADIQGSADAFRYVSQASSGDCSIIARLTSQQNTNGWAKAGVMIRDNAVQAGGINAALVVSNGALNFQWRSATGGATLTTGGGALTPPNTWLKLTRTGNSVSAFKSADGVTWTQVGTAQTLTLAGSATIGLAVTSHANTVTSTATFDNVTATP